MAQDAPTVPGTVLGNLELPYGFKCAGRRTFDRRSRPGIVGCGRPRDDCPTTERWDRCPVASAIAWLWCGGCCGIRRCCWPTSRWPVSTRRPQPHASSLMLDFAHRPDRALLVVLHHGELADRTDAVIRLRRGPPGGAVSGGVIPLGPLAARPSPPCWCWPPARCRWRCVWASERRLAVSAMRTVLQLGLLGVVLERVFAVDARCWWCCWCS